MNDSKHLSDTQSAFESIKNADVNKMSEILISMIHELCEDGIPTHDEMNRWLNTKLGEYLNKIPLEEYPKFEKGKKYDMFAIDPKFNAWFPCKVWDDSVLNQKILHVQIDEWGFTEVGYTALGKTLFMSADNASHALYLATKRV